MHRVEKMDLILKERSARRCSGIPTAKRNQKDTTTTATTRTNPFLERC
jgi:hypothetical protein